MIYAPEKELTNNVKSDKIIRSGRLIIQSVRLYDKRINVIKEDYICQKKLSQCLRAAVTHRA